MKRLLAALLMTAALGCDAGAYGKNDLQLITAYTAKMMCSCLFVMERDEAYCRAWSKQSPAVASASIDFDARSVESDALFMWSATARFVDARHGCVIE